MRKKRLIRRTYSLDQHACLRGEQKVKENK